LKAPIDGEPFESLFPVPPKLLQWSNCPENVLITIDKYLILQIQSNLVITIPVKTNSLLERTNIDSPVEFVTTEFNCTKIIFQEKLTILKVRVLYHQSFFADTFQRH
jgi:hypothetical protein